MQSIETILIDKLTPLELAQLMAEYHSEELDYNRIELYLSEVNIEMEEEKQKKSSKGVT